MTIMFPVTRPWATIETCTRLALRHRARAHGFAVLQTSITGATLLSEAIAKRVTL